MSSLIRGDYKDKFFYYINLLDVLQVFTNLTGLVMFFFPALFQHCVRVEIFRDVLRDDGQN